MVSQHSSICGVELESRQFRCIQILIANSVARRCWTGSAKTNYFIGFFLTAGEDVIQFMDVFLHGNRILDLLSAVQGTIEEWQTTFHIDLW